MVNVGDIFSFLDEAAPVSRKMDFDNVGLLVGKKEGAVTKVIMALDITDDVIDEAVNWGAELIVSHHPVIFHGLMAVTDDDLTGRKVLKMAENGVSAICMHTNLDLSQGGVNDALAESLGIKTEGWLTEHGEDETGEFGLGRWGTVEYEGCFEEFLSRVKNALSADGLRYIDAGLPVRKVAVGGGACGGEMIYAHRLGCDTYITADVKYNTFLDAKELGINLIDAGHFPTENVVIAPLAVKLRENFPEITVKISEVHSQVERFYK